MKRRHFCGVGAAALAGLPGTGRAAGASGAARYAGLGRLLQADLSVADRADLLAFARRQGWSAASLPRVEDYRDAIAEEFRADQIVTVRGLHLSRTEAALVLLDAEAHL